MQISGVGSKFARVNPDAQVRSMAVTRTVNASLGAIETLPSRWFRRYSREDQGSQGHGRPDHRRLGCRRRSPSQRNRLRSYRADYRSGARATPQVRVFGVTATPNRGDRKDARGPVFSNVARPGAIAGYKKHVIVDRRVNLVRPLSPSSSMSAEHDSQGTRRNVLDGDRTPISICAEVDRASPNTAPIEAKR